MSYVARRVLQVCPHDHPPFARLCQTYAQAFAALGLECETVFLGEPFGERVPGAHYLNCSNLKRGRAVRRALQAHVRQLDTIYAMLLCHRYRAHKVSRFAGIRCANRVVVAHEFGFFRSRRRRWAARLLSRQTVFAGVSPAVTSELAQHVRKTAYLANALDFATCRAALKPAATAQKQLGLSAEHFNVAVLGRLHHWKRPELALETLRLLCSGGQPVCLSFIGDGEMRAELEERAANLPVSFAGFQPEASTLLSGFDALLMTSDAREAFGMVALEGLLAALPVVCAPVPGPSSAFGDMLVYAESDVPEAFAATLQNLVQNPPGESYREAAHALVRREFSVSALARRLDDLLR